MSFTSRALACAALLAADPSLAASKKPEAAASHTLRFAWPEGLRLQVQEKHSTRQDEQGEPMVLTRRYPLAVEARGQEHWLVPGPAEVTPAAMAEALKHRPTTVVDPDGGFLRIEASEALVDATLEPVMVWAPPNMPEPQRRKMREQQREQLRKAAARSWEELVGAWRGRTLKPGEVQRRKTTLSLQFEEATPVEAEERLSVEGPLPCAPGGPPRCVRIRRETVADAQALARQAKAYQDSLNARRPKDLPRVRIQEVEARTSLELLTEPTTLVPHLLREEQVSWRISNEMSGSPTGSGLRKLREFTFTPAP